MTVEHVTHSTPELVEAMQRLVPQLSRSAPALDAQAVAELVAQEAVELFVYHAEERAGAPRSPILGMLSLAHFRIPTGVRAWIEDVVVDRTARGRGAAGALVQAALTYAGSHGARTVDLTSRPAREAANRLYRRWGFHLRETNVYRYSHPGDDYSQPIDAL